LGPVKAVATINGHTRTVLRFDGRALLEVPRRASSYGTLFVVFTTTSKAGPGQRLLGWEDADVGMHGLGLLVEPAGRLHVIVRNNGKAGDVSDTRPNKGFETVCVTWGPKGTALYCNGVVASTHKGIDGLSSDPAITSLKIGGPGSGKAERFRGDVAEIRV